MPSVGSCHDGLTSPERCEQAKEASRASLMLRAATQSAGALKDGLYARAGKQSSVADSARRCQREARSSAEPHVPFPTGNQLPGVASGRKAAHARSRLPTPKQGTALGRAHPIEPRSMKTKKRK